MALKRMVLQIGMGTDIRGAAYIKAAMRRKPRCGTIP